MELSLDRLTKQYGREYMVFWGLTVQVKQH